LLRCSMKTASRSASATLMCRATRSSEMGCMPPWAPGNMIGCAAFARSVYGTYFCKQLMR
jgi:hypothetical protein